jgi:hypothetical protein
MKRAKYYCWLQVEMDADDMEQEEEEEEHLQSSNKTSFGISSKSTGLVLL